MVRLEKFLDHSILTTTVPVKGAVVLDCGANRGEFAQWANNRFAASVYSFEADPLLAEQVPRGPAMKCFNVAVSGADW